MANVQFPFCIQHEGQQILNVLSKDNRLLLNESQSFHQV